MPCEVMIHLRRSPADMFRSSYIRLGEVVALGCHQAPLRALLQIGPGNLIRVAGGLSSD